MTIKYEKAASGARIAVMTECPFCGIELGGGRGTELSEHLYRDHSWEDVRP